MAESSYLSPAWLPGGHLQTLYPYFFSPKPSLAYRRERWELPDGDFLDADWLDGSPSAPLLVLFHGLEGNAQGHYALALMQEVKKLGWGGVVVHFRGCSGTPNRLARAYFAGDSAEIDWVLNRLRTQHSGNLYAVGYSLGGNALLRWLGEQGTDATTVLNAAAAVSAPLDLMTAGHTLDQGINRLLYVRHFLRSLKHKVRLKARHYPHLFNTQAIKQANTLWQFDHHYTAPLHGYRSANDYWTRAASLPVLQHIAVPTLLINARNDPFLPGHALPETNQVSSSVTLDFPAQGGHVGFVSGHFPGHVQWLPTRIMTFFAQSENRIKPGNGGWTR
uniref:Putative alpha/beta hydrolase, YheT type n=1 Tax=mine drainage metagenome TaxID=410659 RepID=E6QQX4_9ZZZZ